MVNLYSQYKNGMQFTAGNIVGSIMGISGINPIVDRLNSIADDNSVVTGSLVSGTSLYLYTYNGQLTQSPSNNLDLINKDYADSNGKAVKTYGNVQFAENDISSSWEDITDATLTLNVGSGQSVFLLASANGNTTAAGALGLRFTKAGSILNDSEITYRVAASTIDIGLGRQYLDSTGESGTFVYNVQGMSVNSDGDFTGGIFSAIVLK